MHVGNMLVLHAMFNSLEGLEASVPKFLGLMVVAWFLILAVPASSFDDDLICQDFQDAADTMQEVLSHQPQSFTAGVAGPETVSME